MIVVIDIILIADIVVSFLGALLGAFLMLFEVYFITDFLSTALVPVTIILILSVAILAFVIASGCFESKISGLIVAIYTPIVLLPVWMNIILFIIPSFYEEKQAVLAFFEGIIVLLLSWIPLLISLVPGVVSWLLLILFLSVMENDGILKKIGTFILFIITVGLFFLGTIGYFSNMGLEYIDIYEELYGVKVAGFLESVFTKTFAIVLEVAKMLNIE